MSGQHRSGPDTTGTARDGRFDVAVIGAGMAGLRTAALLADAGRRVVVIDKGRRHGGRMSTRRVDDATFDTGALAFTARSGDLRSALTDWIDHGHAEACTEQSVTTSVVMGEESKRWRGAPTVRSLPTALASHLELRSPRCEVRLATEVLGVARDGIGWRITMAHEVASPALSASALVLTTPAPQTISLLATGAEDGAALVSSSTRALLGDVRYVPSLTVLVRPVDRTLGAPPSLPVAQVGPGTAAPDLLRIHDNRRTGASAVVALTLQADPAFSSVHLEGQRDIAAASLAAQASAVMRAELEVVHIHGWRYAQVHIGIACGDGAPALLDGSSGAPLVLAGDLLAASWPEIPATVAAASPHGVERAFLSGGAAAELLLRTAAVR